MTGAAVGAASLGVWGALGGCSPSARTDEDNSVSEVQNSSFAQRVTKDVDADVVVVGAGVAGLAAAVKCADEGLNTVLIEASEVRGGYGPEGICAVNSSLSKAAGIDLADAEVAELVHHDDEFFNYRLNALFMRDFFSGSGAMIDWLVEKGVEFTGVVDNYKGIGRFETFHWFPGDHNCANAYSAHMEEAFLAQPNTQFLTDTRGRELLLDEKGAVVGVIATNSKEDEVTQFNCKAVILASGGYGANPEMVERYHPTMYEGRWICDGIMTNVGDGLTMAVSAGGRNVAPERCFLGHLYCYGKDESLYKLGERGHGCWVNQDAERFTNEGCSKTAALAVLNPVREQKDTFAIYDAKAIEAAGKGWLDAAKAAAEAGDSELLMADSIADLADLIGVDNEQLVATINRYNEHCDAGIDADYLKDPSFLIKLDTPPFFAAHQLMVGHGSIGGIAVDRNYRVVRNDFSVVEGLFAAGTDSSQLYRETYKIEIPGSCMGTNVFSGMRAAETIASQLHV